MTPAALQDLHQSAFHNVRVQSVGHFSRAKFPCLGQVNTFWEMSQTNRQLSCNTVWPRGKKIKTGDAVSAPSMAQNAEESPLYVTKNSAGNGGRLKEPHNADPSTYGSGHVNALACDMERQCCQTAAVPREELLNADCRVGDSRSFSACATISETARELCKAVSVSLGLAVETSEASDMDAALPPCAANDHLRGEYLFGVGAVPLSCPGAQAAVTEYKCSDRDDRPAHGQKQLVDAFKSSQTAARLRHLAATRTCADEQNFALCKNDDITLEEIDHLDTARAASCPYAHSAPSNLSHFGQAAAEGPCRVYKPPDEARDFGEAMENKFAGYQPEQFNLKIKSEDSESAGALWSTNYTFNDKYNSQFWGSRHSMNAHGAGPSIALCNPYDRSIARPEQWYPGGMLRPPYPNSNYVKAEVGEWLDVAYNDTR